MEALVELGDESKEALVKDDAPEWEVLIEGAKEFKEYSDKQLEKLDVAAIEDKIKKDYEAF